MPLLGCVKTLPVAITIDPMRCMGDWYVQRMIPASSFLEGPAHNGHENYEYDEEHKRVKVTYKFNKGSFEGPVVTTTQRGWVVEDPNGYGTQWEVRPYLGFIGLPFHLPVSLGYNILDIDNVGYSFITCSAPDGSWMYVMTRRQMVPDMYLQPTLDKLESLGFNMKKILKMPQNGFGGDDCPLPTYPRLEGQIDQVLDTPETDGQCRTQKPTVALVRPKRSYSSVHADFRNYNSTASVDSGVREPVASPVAPPCSPASARRRNSYTSAGTNPISGLGILEPPRDA